jgi:O-acetylhomoserine/O-acetylserine sulfhydrylase-like pyridoxal-dependent enzyme
MFLTAQSSLHVRSKCSAGACYLYGRSFNPTVRYLGRQLAAFEGTEAGYAVSSGLAAISATFLQLCNSGDHIVASSAVYGESRSAMSAYIRFDSRLYLPSSFDCVCVTGALNLSKLQVVHLHC